MEDFVTNRQTAATTITFPPYRLRSDVDVLYVGEKVVALEPNAVRVLRFLIENRERVVSKSELLDAVWRDIFTTEDVLKKAVSQIRRSLQDDRRKPHYIETHHRRGYRFIAVVTPPPSNAAADWRVPQTIENEKTENTDSNSGAIIRTQETIFPTDADFNRFVGREIEIELLQSEYRRTLNGGGQTILIVGEPGIGKTQLSASFEDWTTAAHRAVVLRARFYDYEAARVPAGNLFLDLMKEALLRLHRQAGNEIEKTADLRSLAAALGVEMPARIFSLGDESQPERTDIHQIITPLAEFFISVSRVHPLVLIFDDLQWADDLSRRLIGYLMRAAASEKLLILALARREECENPAHEFAVWLNAQAIYRSFSVISLRPLTEDDCGKLLESAFGSKLDLTTIPYQDSNLIYRTTGGNPYFFIETLRLLLAEKVIEKINGAADFTWQWRGLSAVPLPETMRMAARSKLVRLSAEAKDYVEHAAVLGDAFEVETLHEMLGGEQLSNGEVELENSLREAILSQVLTERNVSGAGDCQFYHTTLRRTIYADLSPRRRRRLHQRAAKAIESVYAAETGRFAASLSVHYEAAGEMRHCFEYALSAAAVAGKHFDWKEAADCAGRAGRAALVLEQKATKISNEDHLRLLLTTGEAIMSTGKCEEAEKMLERAAVLAAALGDEVSLAAARSIQGHARVLLGRYREALESSAEALEISRKLNDEEGIADALLQIGSSQYTLGEFSLSCETLQKVVDNQFSGDYQKAVAFGKIGWVHALQGRYQTGKTLLERALAFHRTTGDARQRIILYLCLNWCEHGLGRYESAIRYAAEAGHQARQNLGESFSEAVAVVRIGKSRLAQGLYAETESVLNAVYAKLPNVVSVHCRAETVWFLGRTKIALDQIEAAEKLLGEALAAIREIGDREDEFRILIDVAELQIRRNNLLEALRSAERAASIASELDIADGIGAALVTKSQILLKLNKISEAEISIRAAVELLDAAESGERWRAFFTLAEVLAAAEDNCNLSNFPSKDPPEYRAGEHLQASETALRRTIELLKEIHLQFDETDAVRAQMFLAAHQQPAQRLSEMLQNSDRQTEAAQIRRFWRLA